MALSTSSLESVAIGSSFYQEWCTSLKIELKKKSKINVQRRLVKIEDIVNRTVRESWPVQLENAYVPFRISVHERVRIETAIEESIVAWRGVEIDVCKNKEKKDFNAYQSTARNWFNRNKAKIYGSSLFYEVIFHHTLKFCATLPEAALAEPNHTMLTFVLILHRILDEAVQFPRTKLQPLIPHQTLMQPNRFKKACEKLMAFYRVEWRPSLVNKRDRDRAKKIHDSFLQGLASIRELLTNQTTTIQMPYPFDNEPKVNSISNRLSAVNTCAEMMASNTTTPSTNTPVLNLQLKSPDEPREPNEQSERRHLKLASDWSHTTVSSTTDDIISPGRRSMADAKQDAFGWNATSGDTVYEPTYFNCEPEHEVFRIQQSQQHQTVRQTAQQPIAMQHHVGDHAQYNHMHKQQQQQQQHPQQQHTHTQSQSQCSPSYFGYRGTGYHDQQMCQMRYTPMRVPVTQLRMPAMSAMSHHMPTQSQAQSHIQPRIQARMQNRASHHRFAPMPLPMPTLSVQSRQAPHSQQAFSVCTCQHPHCSSVSQMQMQQQQQQHTQQPYYPHPFGPSDAHPFR